MLVEAFLDVNSMRSWFRLRIEFNVKEGSTSM